MMKIKPILKLLLAALLMSGMMFVSIKSNAATQSFDLTFNASTNLNELSGKKIKNDTNIMTVQAPRAAGAIIGFQVPSQKYITTQGVTAMETGVKDLYVSVGYRINGNDNYLDMASGVDTRISPDGSENINFISSLLTDGDTLPAPGEYNVNELLIVATTAETAEYTYNLYLRGHITVTAGTCAISSANNITVNWPSLSSDDIENGSVKEKSATVTVGCDGSSNIAPMQVTFSSNEGSADAPNGVVKTTSDNLGLKLTWASDDSIIPIDQPISVPAPDNGGIKNLSVNAKPVKTGSGNIQAGDFSSLVTMVIEYH